jgi:hypothetical protein
MRFSSELSTNALQKLQRLTSAVLSGKSSSQHVYAAVGAIDSVFVDLGRQVRDHDDLAMSVKSEEELIFRAARLIILHQLDRVDQAIAAITSSAISENVRAVWGRLQLAIPIARSELSRITELWVRCRTTDNGLPRARETLAYHDAVCEALKDLERLDHIPEVERLLYRGVASTAWPAIAAGCEQILATIHARINVQAARRLWTARNGWTRAIRSQ